MRVVNECRVDFQYRLSPKSPLVVKTISSNVVSTDIVKNILKIDKIVDKMHTYAFDILTYTVVISNVSDFIVTNIFFKDKIFKGTRFIENSVKINNIKKRCITLEKGFYICDIEPRNSVNISFKVIVLPQCFCGIIKNYCIVEHDYIYNVEKLPIKLPIQSDEVYTEFENKVFKQLSVNNSIKVRKGIFNIIDFEVNVKIIKLKVANTPTNILYRSNKTNICTLVVIGIIEYEISYKSDFKNKTNKNKGNNIKRIKKEFGFSSYMIVPCAITYCNENQIKMKIEYVSVNLLDKNTIFTSANLLLFF